MTRSLFDPYRSCRKFFNYIKFLRKENCGVPMLQNEGVAYYFKQTLCFDFYS